MHRFHAPPESCRADTIRLDGEEARHATQVLRLRPGDAATVLDGAGGEMRCVLAEATRREVTLTVKERITHPTPAVAVTLFQSVPKGKTMEWIVEKATELGAAAIVPVLTARTVVRVDEEDAAAKRSRWERTAIEAVKQCGNPWLPRLTSPVTLPEALALAPDADLKLVASLEPGARRAGRYLEEFRVRAGRQPRHIAVWIGPEGDFTPAEYAALAAEGAQPLSLGGLVLRCETAAIAALAILLHEAGAPSA
jgi:16S rRNA (uracil1498-N3)-methyltransferase